MRRWRNGLAVTSVIWWPDWPSGPSENEIGRARISMMARNTNAPFKGRIQMRKAYHLQIITFGFDARPVHTVVRGSDICSAANNRRYSITSSARARSVGGTVISRRCGAARSIPSVAECRSGDRMITALSALPSH